ncbi:L-lactate permease [Streptomyces sp. NPDC093992]|uniref:L-lactate permease n=1 Tax=Streptomyces sp. NPDC093992 TaxID=3366053 RepID=UPI0038379C3D
MRRPAPRSGRPEPAAARAAPTRWRSPAAGTCGFCAPRTTEAAHSGRPLTSPHRAPLDALQVTAAQQSGPSPGPLAAADGSDGALGKTTPPRNPAIACAAAGLAGRAGGLLRKAPPRSLGLPLVMRLLVVGRARRCSPGRSPDRAGPAALRPAAPPERHPLRVVCGDRQDFRKGWPWLLISRRS